jgi:phage tail-like protein
VDLGTGNTDGPDAGFQEVSGIGMEVTVSEYRNGNERENAVRKITGLNKATDVTMKRGVIGSLSLYNWLNQIRNGDQNALRNIVIQLQNEDHTAVVQTWKLLNAKGTDVAMEELVIAYERLEMD